MKFLTLQDMKAQARIDPEYTAEDTLLTNYGNAAERKIFSDTGYTYEELLERGDDDNFPEDLVLAGLMLTATWYRYRENIENLSMSHVDYSYNWLISFARRTASQMGQSGRDSGGIRYQIVGTFYAAEDFNRGTQSLRAGAVDAYDVVMFRMRHTDRVDRRCLIRYNGRWYEIISFNDSYQDNTIQITAREMANQNVTIVS